MLDFSIGTNTRETQDNIDSGMSPEEARYAALRKFGNVARVKEQTLHLNLPCRRMNMKL
jgi:hypothetical protein